MVSALFCRRFALIAQAYDVRDVFQWRQNAPLTKTKIINHIIVTSHKITHGRMCVLAHNNDGDDGVMATVTLLVAIKHLYTGTTWHVIRIFSTRGPKFLWPLSDGEEEKRYPASMG